MRTIWKYELTHQMNIREIPRDFEVLSVKEQFDSVVIYCLVETENERDEILFEIFGTGEDLDELMHDGDEYLGTVLTQNGGLAWHVFMNKDWSDRYKGF